jgi:HAMP domain-containing protein
VKRPRFAFFRTVRGRLTLALAATALLLVLPVIAASFHLHRHYQVIESLRELEQRPRASAAIVQARAVQARRLHARAAAITDEAFRDVLTLAALGVIAIVFGTIALPARLLLPLRRLSALVRQAQGGNLRVVAAQLGRDEIDELTADLSRVLQELARFDELKRGKIAALAAQRDILLNLLPHPAVLLDGEGRTLQVSRSFLLAFATDAGRLIDQPLLSTLGLARSELAPALKQATEGESLELRLELGGCEQRARLHSIEGAEPAAVLLTLEPL